MTLDIFNKKSTKEENKVKVIVDYREKNSLVPSYLIKNNCQIEFKKLEIGDYISGETLIERKTFPDLQASILDKRIFNQIASISKNKEKLLIIEGEKDILRLSPNSIRGFILYAVKILAVPIIFTKNEEETAEYINLLAKKKTKYSISLRPSIKFKTKEARLSYILEGFPGIGPISSKKLIEKFKSIKNITNATKEELQEILGNKTNSFLDLLN